MSRREEPWVESYPDGRPKTQGVYAAGKRTGLWRTFGPAGELLSETYYRDGVRLWRVDYMGAAR
jgi:antitoxin component YwqK of YwqJK toxin-antitoxin module